MAKECPLFRPYKNAIETILAEQTAADTWFQTQSANVSIKKSSWICPRCGKLFISRLAWDIHRCPPPHADEDGDFPFTLLPPGYGTFRAVFQSLHGGEKRKTAEPNWERIDQLEMLKPVARHYGRGGWFGYGVFEFEYSDLVVLETPLEGNATYILGGDWKDAISLTKAEVRQGYGGKYLKIVHRGDNWRHRVERALKRNNLSS